MLELKLHIWLLKVSALLLVWTFQYLLYVPAAALWRAVKLVVKVLGYTVLWVFVPILGWFILYKRWKDKQHTELAYAMRGEEMPNKSLLTPWGLDWLNPNRKDETNDNRTDR